MNKVYISVQHDFAVERSKENMCQNEEENKRH